MTTPWLMNCPHADSGWCAECVRELGNENLRLLQALEAERGDAALYRAMLDACDKLPKWWDISFTVEKDAGWIHMSDPEGNSITVDEFGSVDSSLPEQVAEALAFALEHDPRHD